MDPLWLFVSGWVSGWARYVVALLLVAAAVGCSLLFPFLVEDRAFVGITLVVVLISSRLCGFGPSVMATAIGAFAVAYLLPPSESWWVEASDDVALLGVFLAVSAVMTILTARRRPKARLS